MEVKNEQSDFSGFIKKHNIDKLNIWTLGYIPINKKPSYKYKKGEYHWGDYYDYLKLEIEKSSKKPKLIILDKNSFYHFMEDCINDVLKIKTLII